MKSFSSDISLSDRFASPCRTIAGRAGCFQPPTFDHPFLSNVGIDQKLGTMIPSELVFNDEHGRSVRLGDFFGNRPVVLWCWSITNVRCSARWC